MLLEVFPLVRGLEKTGMEKNVLQYFQIVNFAGWRTRKFFLSTSFLEKFQNSFHHRAIVHHQLHCLFICNDLDGLGDLVDGEDHIRLSLLA